MKLWLKRVLLFLLAVLLVVEEWLWDVMTALGRLLAKLLHLERFELWLAQAPRHVALLAFLVPVLVVMPLNVFALWIIARGMVLRGILLEIVAKLLGTLLVARVFALTRTQLLTYGWFAWLYHTVTGWLRWAHARLAMTPAYIFAVSVKAQLRQWAVVWRGRLRAWLN